MRYYLDTNTLIFVLSNEKDNISSSVSNILSDYSNLFYVSSIVIQELVLLYKIGKLKSKHYKTVDDILFAIKETSIETIYFNEHHFSQYLQLVIADDHKDMNDHAIIAQSISDKIPVISSDNKFKLYISQGLDFVFNKR